MINGRKVVALCTSRIGDSAMHELVSEVNEKIIEYGGRVIIFHLCSDNEWLKDYMSADVAVFDLIDYNVIDVVVMFDERIKDHEASKRIISEAKANGVPVIAVDSSQKECITLNFDFETGFEKVVRHMIEEHMPEKIHFLAGYKDNSFSNARIGVFKKVLAENGRQFCQDMISYGDFWSEPTRAVMEKLIAKGDIPDAIICANDIMAINATVVLQEHGYVVPDDVIVSGFDGIDEIYHTEPMITSCRCDYSIIAKRLNEIIIECFEGKSDIQHHLIEPEFIQGESCGCKTRDEKRININRMNAGFYRYQDSERALSCVSERIQMCHSLEEVTAQFGDETLQGLSCVLLKTCLDPSIHTEDNVGITTFDDDFVVVGSAVNPDKAPYEKHSSEVYDNLENIIEKGVPVVFNALGSMNSLLGFVCFYYDCSDIISYGKIPQIITALSNGIRGYMNVQRQIYLRKQMEDMYRYDALTGLYNRMGFNIAYEEMIAQLQESGDSLTVILSDLDGLKPINDQYGHVVGDKAIMAIANALKEACPEDALCVRLGGDEMLAVMKGECDVQAIRNKISEYLDHYNQTAGLPCKVGASLGVYQTNEQDKFSFDRLVIESDKAMYEEKMQHHGVS